MEYSLCVEYFWVLWVKHWVWDFRGDSHEFFRGCGMGMGTEVQSARLPCTQSTDPIHVQFFFAGYEKQVHLGACQSCPWVYFHRPGLTQHTK